MYVLLMDSFLSAWKVHKMTTSLHSVAVVFIESAKACDFYAPRALTIYFQLSGQSRKVTHFHYTAWPDHGVPDYATSILAFHRRVMREHKPSKGPLLVHCR